MTVGAHHETQRVLGAAVSVALCSVYCAAPAPVVTPDGAVPEESFALVAVTIFDGDAFRRDQDVWVEDGRIRAVGQALKLPDGLARVDGHGQTLMPGLIDSHVHTFGTTLNDAIRFGVTSVLDQFTDPALAASKRAARATLARTDEADLFSAGMLATAAGGHGTQFGAGMAVEPVHGPSEAASWVQARKAEGSDWIKIVYEDGVTYGMPIPSLERETIGALIGAAHAEGLLAVMHVSTLAHALEAVEWGSTGWCTSGATCSSTTDRRRGSPKRASSLSRRSRS